MEEEFQRTIELLLESLKKLGREVVHPEAVFCHYSESPMGTDVYYISGEICYTWVKKLEKEDKEYKVDIGEKSVLTFTPLKEVTRVKLLRLY